LFPVPWGLTIEHDGVDAVHLIEHLQRHQHHQLGCKTAGEQRTPGVDTHTPRGARSLQDVVKLNINICVTSQHRRTQQHVNTFST
jgi:hypothetical protein